jgi:CubicO group peptidase (beta-lactamase class C family)
LFLFIPRLITSRELLLIYASRHLLSHSSGFGYDLMNPNLAQWRLSRNEAPGVKGLPILERVTMPLSFEPGTGWEYGCSTDWVGVLITRLTNISLEAYFQRNVFGPLGIKNLTFHREGNEDVERELVKMSARGGIPEPMFTIPVRNDEGVKWFDEEIYDNPTVDEYGGVGLVGSPVDYFKILESILRDDGKLLKGETVEEMFKGQLSEGGREAYQAFSGLGFYKEAFASHGEGVRVDYALGGMVVLDDEGTGRKRATLSWSGLPNLLW